MAQANRRYLPHFLLVLVQLIFSGWHIVGSVVLKAGADPLVFALYREILSTILMFLFAFQRRAEMIVHREDYPRFLLLGFCSFANVVGTIFSLQYISATRFALFQPSIPCIATIISVILRMEPSSPLKLGGIALAVAGSILIEVWNSGESGADEKNVTLGTIIVLIQCTGLACLIVFQKPLLKRYDSTFLTFVYYAVGTVITILMCIAWATRFTGSDFYFDGIWLPWLGLAYVTIFATFFNYNVYAYACSMLAPSITTIYVTLQPVGTVILSLIIFGYVLTLSQGVGGALVALGLIVTVFGRSLELKKHPEELADHKASITSYLVIEDVDAIESLKNNRPFSRYHSDETTILGGMIIAARFDSMETNVPGEDNVSQDDNSRDHEVGEPLHDGQPDSDMRKPLL